MDSFLEMLIAPSLKHPKVDTNEGAVAFSLLVARFLYRASAISSAYAC